jgi:hypothetical protein
LRGRDRGRKLKFKISHHAEDEINRRRIPFNLVESVLENPQQVVEEYGDKKAYQSKIDFGDGKIYLLRVIVDENVKPMVVVTVYRTSKIKKYWREL